MRAAAVPVALAVALSGFSLAGEAPAHDFRVQPERYIAAPGETVGLRLFIGDAFGGQPFLRDPKHLAEFFVVGPRGRMAIPGRPNRLRVGEIGPLDAGAWVVAYRSNFTLSTMEAERFDDYLRKEGFEEARRVRAARGESAAPGREAYARAAKAIVEAGGDSAGYNAVLGLPLELAPERAPAGMRPGEVFTVRLLLAGEALADASVTAFAAAAPDRPVRARTDSAGRAGLTLDRAGAWLVRAVHMAPAAPGRDADWESLWASLTFSVPDG